MGLDTDVLQAGLERWVSRDVLPGAAVADLRPMPGNAGLSFGFDVVDGAGAVRRSFVVRLAPPGVRRSGNTDVLRQVPLLTALEGAGIPVAPLVWSTGDAAWFGTDAVVQERLPALPLHMVHPEAGVRPVDGDVGPYLHRAVDTLVAVHALDWQTRLSDWEEPRSVADEVGFWVALLAKHPDPAWTALGERLGAALLETDPDDHRVGLFHGDFQTNNVLYDPVSGELVAVIDWEIAGIGATGLDLGWLMMMTDNSCWGPERAAAQQVLADPAELVAWYEQAAGHGVPHAAWYEALACYRFGAIAGFNVRLHRTGRRVDASYEELASSVPALFEAGLRLVGR